MDPKAWKMCGRKKSYHTKRAANRANERLKIEFRVYECPICYCFHLTKNNHRKD